MQRAKWRDSHTEYRCWPALTSLRGLSAHLPGRAGAGSCGYRVQIPGRGLGLAAWTQPEGASAPQLARSESRKMSGPAEEARDHCFSVREERGFLPHLPTEGEAPPKGAPEMGMSHRPQRQAWNTNAAAAATKNPVCKHRSLSTPPLQEPVQPATARVPWSRDNIPRRTHSTPQAVATSHRPLPPQDHPTFQLWLPYPYLPLAWVSKSSLISRCFNPLLSGWEQMPEVNLHAEVGPKPNRNPRSCANKEEKGNFSM